MAHPLAGQPAPAESLIDVDRLLAAYYDLHPEPGNPAHAVAFGTSGHRGKSLAQSFNDDHIAAISQAIAEYRKGQGIDGPLYIGMDTHALSRAGARHRAGGLRGQRSPCDGPAQLRLHAHAGHLARHPDPQQPRQGRRGRRRRRHPVAQSTDRRRFQVQSALRRPRRHRRDQDHPGSRQRDSGPRTASRCAA